MKAEHQVAEKCKEVGAQDEFQGNAEKEEDLRSRKLEIVWIRVIIMSVLHLGALYGMYLRTQDSIYTEIFMKASWLFVMFGITAGYHRLYSHRSYKASKFLEVILLIAISGTYQNSIFIWARDHRVHHKYSETHADPHNAKRGFFFSHVGWLMVKKQREVTEKGKEIDLRDLKANPIVMFQHKHYLKFMLLFTIILPTWIPWYFWGENLVSSFFINGILKMVLILHATWCINSFAHLYGYKPYNKLIGPTENHVGWILNIGEGFHNYHHTFPSDYKAGEFSVDCRNATALTLNMFKRLGLAYDFKTTPQHIVDKWVEKYGDKSNDRNTFLRRYFSKKSIDFFTQWKYMVIIVLVVRYV